MILQEKFCFFMVKIFFQKLYSRLNSDDLMNFNRSLQSILEIIEIKVFLFKHLFSKKDFYFQYLLVSLKDL